MGCLNTKPSGGGGGSVTVPEVSQNIKILLLGAGESGKSTIFKQMKILHSNGFTKQECESYRDTVHGNVIKAIRALTEASQALDIPLEEPENQPRADKIMELDDDDILSIQRIWSPDLGRDIAKLWSDPGIQKVFLRRNEFQLDDSTSYYMNDLDRISKLDYVPTQEDVLRTRVKTTGVVEMNYQLTDNNGKQKTVQMMDVGGQRNERKKWIHCFEGVNAVIFVIAVSEYDGKCYEDNETPRMQESLDLFSETINSKWFVDTPVILFMNKTDLFKEKVGRSPISAMFPEYSGPQEYEASLEYIKKKFCEKSRYPDKKILCVPTSATDTDSLQKAFDTIKETLTTSKPSSPIK